MKSKIIVIGLIIATTSIAAIAQVQIPTPTILGRYAEDWSGSQVDYGGFEVGDIFAVGTGDYVWGFGFAGMELRNTRKIKVQILEVSDYKSNDPNSFVGFFIDYSTHSWGYYTRVEIPVVSFYSDDLRITPNPMWGTKSVANTIEDRACFISNEGEPIKANLQPLINRPDGLTCTININRYAPTDWDNKEIITAGIQNTGSNSVFKARIIEMSY